MKSLREIGFFFGFIPLLLIIIFLLPPNFKGFLILNPSHPTLLSLFFQNYTHSSLLHLLNNLVPYSLVIFLLLRLEVNKKAFHIFSALNLILLPFILSGLMLRFSFGYLHVQGFSGVLAGFIGYFCYTIFAYVKKKYYGDLRPQFVFLILVLNLSFVAVSANKLLLTIAVTLAALFLFHVNFSALRAIVKALFIKTIALGKEPYPLRCLHLMLFFLILFFLFPMPALVPKIIQTKMGVTNIFLHYAGYIFGVLVFPIKDWKMFISLKSIGKAV